MGEEIELLLRTVKASDIRRVAIVDDVFDTPSFGVDGGPLLDFLEKGEAARANLQIGHDAWNAAIKDLRNGEHDSDNVANVVELLYKNYISTGDGTCDPGGLFARTRDDNLKYLRPLLELLSSCESLSLQKFGSQSPQVNDEDMPDLVLVDLYLNSEISPIDAPEEAAAQAAVDISLKRVEPLLKKQPTVILMSSHGEKGKQEADTYRRRLNNRIYASRFGFVDKGQVSKHPDRGLTIEEAARDTLLDVFQTFKFGKALAEAMDRWILGAKDAVDAIGKDVSSLELKEISYLVQFRLAAEGQGLEEYLEWFFGEALLDYIIRAVDKAHAENPLEVNLDPAAAALIDGGFEPTEGVAKMYHRVRVESKRTRERKNFRLGDLYLDKKNKKVLAVMTPDCDLVLRRDGKKEVRNAAHLLFVPGIISDLEKASASVGDFLMIGETPHNVQWAYKKLFSAPFAGTLEKAGQSGADLEYLGALRPLYAQEIQANLMNHVGRVGVAVPPVIGIPAVATIVVRTPTTLKEISSQGTTFDCSLILARSSQHQPRVVFDRGTIRKIKAVLTGLPANDLLEGSAKRIDELKQESGASLESALKLGPEIGTELSNGIMLATGKRDATGPWCAIYISRVTIQVAEPKRAAQRPAPAHAVEDATVLATPAVGLVEPEAPVTLQVASHDAPQHVDSVKPQE